MSLPTTPRLAALLTASALLGGGAGAGALAASGVLDRTVTRTVAASTPISATTPTSGADGALDAEALYAQASPGVVSISAGNATGTGFLYDDRGRVLTAAHVVDGASSVTVKLQDGTKRAARVLGTDDATDVAVLSVDVSGLRVEPLTLGDSSALAIGDPVAAIGDPFGYERSFSTGVVSGLDRTIAAPNGFTVAHAVQTDAALNPGNSGGPLVDADGRVIGIVDQIATGDSGAEQSSGVGFAVPISLVRKELRTLEAGKTVRHAYIGLSTGTATGTGSGALVGSVTPGGPAAAAGLRRGDVVTAIDGKPVDGSAGLVAAVAAQTPGDRVKVTVRRGGTTREVTVTLATQPARSPQQQ